MSSMLRLLVLAVFLGVCSGGRVGYNYQLTPAVSHASYPSVVDGDGSMKSLYFYADGHQQISQGRVPQHAASTSHVAPSQKKNLQVIFVKTPRNTAYEDTLLNLAKEAIQTQTVVYVLSKEPDIEDLKRRFEEIRATAVRMPEVRFVKYRTEDEAVRAQQEIQAQYERLPGSSKTIPTGNSAQYGGLPGSSKTIPTGNSAQYDRISGSSKTIPTGTSGSSHTTFSLGTSGNVNQAVTTISNNQQFKQSSGSPFSLLPYAGELLPGIPGSTKAIASGNIPHLKYGSGPHGGHSYPPYADTGAGTISYPTYTSSDSHDDDVYTNSRPPFLPTGVDVVPGSSYLPPQRNNKQH